MLKLLSVAIGLFFFSFAVSADVYVWRDANGVLNYSQDPPPEGAREVRKLRTPQQGRYRGGETGPGTAGTAGSAGGGTAGFRALGRGAPSSGGTATAGGATPALGGTDATSGGTSSGSTTTSGTGTSTAGGTTTPSGGGTSTAGGTTTPSGGGTSTAGGTTTPSGGGTSTAGSTTTAGGGTSTSGGTTTAGGGTSTSGGTSTAGGGTTTSGGTTTAGGGTSTSGGTTTAGGGTSTSGGATTTGGGTSTSGGTTPAPGDTTPPSMPTGLTASDITPTSLTLSWDASTDNVGVTGARVYRDGTLIIPVTTIRTVSIAGLSPDTSYAFTIAAFDAADNTSLQSAALTVTTPATASAATPCAIPAGGYEGFGRNTTGGAGKPVYRVTNLNNSGAGSLRDAISQGNRCVVFDVAGTISLTSFVKAGGPNITIDGFTAPSPGINLTGWGFALHGSPYGTAANIIVRGIRIRGTVGPESVGADGFQISNVSNFVIDHVSIDQWGDGSLDIADGSRDFTIQWSIIGKGRDVLDKSLVVGYLARRGSLHHNLFINSHDRSPLCDWSDNLALSPPAGEIVCDFRNNVVWGYGWTGTSVRRHGTANIVNNYYFSAAAPTADAALYFKDGGVAYASGNYSPNGINIDARGNRATPFPAPVLTTTDALTAAREVVLQAGARGPNFGLDAADLNYIGQVSLP